MTRATANLQIDPRLTPEDIQEIEFFLKKLRAAFGKDWGFLLDVRDNIAQVLRCIYSDTGDWDLRPVINVPFISDLSWRVTAIEKNGSLYFEEVDMMDPRSYHIRKSFESQQLAMFPIRADINIGLLSMFSGTDTPYLSGRDVESIQKECQTLVPTLEHLIWDREQEILNDAMQKIRRRETPIFICQLFNRMLETPIIFLERSNGDIYQSLCDYGLPNQRDTAKSLFKIPDMEGKIFHLCRWKEISKSADIDPEQRVTIIYIQPGEHLFLALGDLRMRGQTRDDFAHYMDQVEALLIEPPYQISTLTFLLHLQHWIRSEERDINVMFQHIIDTLIPFLNADFGALALIQKDAQRMLLVSQAGDFVNPIKDLPLESDESGKPNSILSWVFQNGRSYLAPDISKDPYYRAFNPSIRSEMCAPIRVRGEMIGLFSVSSRKVNLFKEADISKLEFFSDQIGIALFQAGVIDKARMETESAKKIDQSIKFGFHNRTHAKDLTYNFGNLVGDPQGGMRPVFEAIQRINGSGRDDLNVLITGETGCGKEMVSFALHNSSSRGDRSMVVANFASFGGDPNLIQSELFGHEKGSFSGATSRRIGCIEQADKSTLLIDEVGDIVSSVQIKLLRVLQQGGEKRFQRLGGQQTIQSNVRILAATHKDLSKEVEDGRFREDLFYRLQTLVIRIPPLREHKEDIPLLATHFTAKYEREVPGLRVTVTEDAMKALQEYNWPGNIRQLEAVINRALVLFAEGGHLNEKSIVDSLNAEQRRTKREVPLFDSVCKSGENAFWQMIYQPYRKHEITQSQLVGLVRDALTASMGSYKQAAFMMGIAEKDYNRFLDFLKNSDAKLDYRKFRKK